MKGEGVEDNDCKMAVETLFSVLYTMVRVFAPFTPFLTEQMYQVLKPLVKVSFIRQFPYTYNKVRNIYNSTWFFRAFIG